MKGNQGRFLLLSLIVLGLPRLIRLAAPVIWVEDSYYLYAGQLILRGMHPFRDFAFTQYPGLEVLLACAYRVLGSAIRSGEICTQFAAFLASCGVLLLATRLAGRKAGLIAAGLLAWHSLLFRYHLAEREVFALIPIIGLMLIVSSGSLFRWRRMALFVILAALGISLKLTFLLSCAGPVLFLTVMERKREALLACLLSSVAFLLPTCLLLFLYRDEFVWQAFLYHLAKGANVHDLRDRLDVTCRSLDFALALGLPALAFLALEKERRVWLLPVVWLVPEGVIYTLFSPDLWPHNTIATLPGLCCLAGMWLAEVFSLSYWRVDLIARRHRVLLILLCPVLLASVFPLKNLQWERGSVYGLGFLSRKEIRETVALITDHAGPEDRILVPEYLAVEAHRRLWVEDRIEAVGVIYRLRQAAATVGLMEACREMSQEGFWEQAAGSQDPWRGPTIEAIRARQIPVIIPYVDVHLSDALIQDAGYVKVMQGAWYPVWCLMRGPENAIQ